MIVCVDIDNVCNNLTECVLAIYNSRTGKNIKMSDLTTYDFHACLPKEDADGLVALFSEKELWDSLTPIKDSQWGLQTLIHQGHRVYLATATAVINLGWKTEWVKKYYPFFDTNNIIRIMDKSLLKADVLVDDCMEQLTKSICERIVLDYQWNRDANKDFAYDILRVNDWKGIVNTISEIERKDREWETR